MRVYEFPAKISPDGNVELPGPLVEQLADKETVRVIIIVDDQTNAEEDAVWSHLAAEQFLKGYANVDAIYDEK